MSVGEIRVVMTLDDTGFRQRITQNGRELTNLNSHIINANRGVNNLSGGFGNLGASLRNTIISLALAKSAIESIHAVTTGFALGIANTNGEIEKMTALMKGMSKATTDAGKNSDAAKSMDYLFNMAKNTPVELKGLTDAFVKLKSTGIDPMAGSLQSLVDANSHFGGTTDTLKHAAVAIQQMASKGKVSMEELRQQLAEAIPNAAQLMARGLGLSMDDFYDKVSKGMVNSKEALLVMFREMDVEFAGSAKAMMNTWVGLTSNLKTEWTLFQKTIGDASFFDEAKNAIKEMTAALKTDDAKLFGLTVGKMLSDMVVGLVEATKWVIQNRTEIGNWVKAALQIALITKAVTTTVAVLTTLTATVRAVSAAWLFAIPQFTAAAALIAETGQVATVTAMLMETLGLSMTALVPIIGGIAVALGLGVMAWKTWGNEADKVMDEVTMSVKNGVALSVEQIDKLKNKQREMANSGHGGEQGQVIENTLKQNEINNNTRAVTDLRDKLAKDAYDNEQKLLVDSRESLLAIEERYNALDKSQRKAAYSQMIKDREAVFDKMAEDQTKFLYNQRDSSKSDIERVTKAAGDYAPKDKVDDLKTFSAGVISEHLKKNNDLNDASNPENYLSAGKGKSAEQKAAEKAAKAAAAEAKRIAKAAAAEAEQYANFTINQGARLAKLKAELNQPLMLGIDKRTIGPEEAKINYLIEQGKKFSEQDKQNARDIDASNEKIKQRVKAIESLNSITKQQQTTMAKLKVDEAAAEAQLKNGGYSTMSKQSLRLAENVEVLKERFSDLKGSLSASEWDEFIKKMSEAEGKIVKLGDRISQLNHDSADKKLAKEINNSLISDTKERLDGEYEAKVAAFMQDHNLTMNEYRNRINNSKDLNDALAAMDMQYARSVENPIMTISRSWANLNQNLKDSSVGWMQSFTDNIIQMTTTGKSSFRDMTKSILLDIAKMMAQKAFSTLINSALGAFGGSGDNPFNGKGPMASFQNSANGNIMTPMGPLPLNRYANGGIATTPQVSIFGEGRQNEAYVPLPDGRSIPVTMKGGNGGSSPSVSIQINVDNTGDTQKSTQKGDDADWGKLAVKIKTITMQTIYEQKRPGGALSKSSLTG